MLVGWKLELLSHKPNEDNGRTLNCSSGHPMSVCSKASNHPALSINGKGVSCVKEVKTS